MDDIRIRKIVFDLCWAAGYNAAHDWEGIENDEDIELYVGSLLKDIAKWRREATSNSS